MSTSTLHHRLGLKGQFGIPAHLQQAAAANGLRLRAAGEGEYTVESAYGDEALDRLCPPLIERQGSRFSLNSLKSFLSFLHQPIRASIGRGYDKSEAQAQREQVHQLLRMLTTGSVRILADPHAAHGHGENCDHAETENAMRDRDAWAAHSEIGNPETVQSAVPGSRIDPRQGYIFSLHDMSAAGPAAKTLHAAIRSAAVQTGASFGDDGSLTFTGAQFASFTESSRRETFTPLIKAAAFEEDVQTRLNNIDARVCELASSSSYDRLRTQQGSGEKRLRDLLMATSALSPVAHSAELREIWKKYHFSALHDGTLESLQNDYAVLQETIKAYAHHAQVSDLQAEAIAQEFYPLLAFSGRMAAIISRAHEEAEEPETRFKTARDVFRTASEAGVALTPELMEGRQADILAALEKHLGQGAGKWAQFKKATVQSGKGFVSDLVTFARERPYIVSLAVGLGVALYMSRTGSAPADLNQTEVLFMGSDGKLVKEMIENASVPKETLSKQNWHWDIGTLGPYKHFIFDNIVVGIPQKLIDWGRIGTYWAADKAGLSINIDNGFFNAAADTIQPLSDKLFKANLLQDLAHAGFWTYIGVKGHKHGFRDAAQIVRFLMPMGDLGYQAVRGFKDRGESVAERLLRLTEGTHEYQVAPDITEVRPHQHLDLMVELARTADLRSSVANSIPADIREAQGSIKVGGLKHQFQISAGNYGPLLKALDQFDVVMTHVAAQADRARPTYQAWLHQKTGALRSALVAYQANGDVPALQAALGEHLGDLSGAQERLSGESSIYRSMFGLDPDPSVARALTRAANQRVGTYERQEIRQFRLDEFARDDLPAKDRLKLRASLLGGAVWNGMVRSAQALQSGVGAVATRPAIIATVGVGAAASALDLFGVATPVTQPIASAAGSAVSGGMTVGTFLGWNVWDDLIKNHIGGALVTLVAGATAGAVDRRVVRPLWRTGRESAHDLMGVELPPLVAAQAETALAQEFCDHAQGSPARMRPVACGHCDTRRPLFPVEKRDFNS